MRIGIITFHFPYNCGAVLQCYALQTKIEQLGHQAGIINYRPWYHQNRYVALKNPIYFACRQIKKKDESDHLCRRTLRGVDGFLRSIYSWRNYWKITPRDKKFRVFVKNYLHETKVYRTLDQLQKNPPDFELYICGSDQIWNAKLTEGKFDPAYFLYFGGKEKGRISFSAGANFDETNIEDSNLLKYLSSFDAIALREEKCYEVVRSTVNGKVPVEITIDPTFLLDAKEYYSIMTKNVLVSEPFILTYIMPNETQHKVFNAAKILGERKRMRVIDVSGNPSKNNAIIADNRVCGPDEFLWYIEHASYILTNSFHGTAFSIIFQKQFAVIPHSDTGNRVSELLKKLDLSSCCAKTGPEAADIAESAIDYKEASETLLELKEKSIQYLLNCISITERNHKKT